MAANTLSCPFPAPSHPPPSVSDPFEQIGPKLRQAREKAGLEIAEAARGAQIPRPAAEALEKEEFSYFASPVYAKSFLLQYSEFLEVDARAWLDALQPGSFMASGALLKGPEAPTRKKEQETTREPRNSALAVFILLLLTAAIILGAIKAYEFFESHLSEEPAPPSTPEEQAQPVDSIPGTELPRGNGER